jgi:hypothetical protein
MHASHPGHAAWLQTSIQFASKNSTKTRSNPTSRDPFSVGDTASTVILHVGFSASCRSCIMVAAASGQSLHRLWSTSSAELAHYLTDLEVITASTNNSRFDEDAPIAATGLRSCAARLHEDIEQRCWMFQVICLTNWFLGLYCVALLISSSVFVEQSVNKSVSKLIVDAAYDNLGCARTDVAIVMIGEDAE